MENIDLEDIETENTQQDDFVQSQEFEDHSLDEDEEAFKCTIKEAARFPQFIWINLEELL